MTSKQKTTKQLANEITQAIVYYFENNVSALPFPFLKATLNKELQQELNNIILERIHAFIDRV